MGLALAIFVDTVIAVLVLLFTPVSVVLFSALMLTVMAFEIMLYSLLHVPK